MRHSNTIAIDASRLTVGQLTGTETYTAELLRSLADLQPPEKFELYLNAAAPPGGLPPLGEPVCIPFPRLWTHLRLAWELQRRRPRLLFVPAHVVPMIHPPAVVTIHDLGYLRFPEAHPPATVRMLDMTTRWSSHAAKRIIAISHITKDDLVRSYGTEPDKITVIHHGISPRFRPAPLEEVSRVAIKHEIRGPYVLAVGTVQPRKNYARLAEAIARHASRLPGLRLVIAGKRGWFADSVERKVAASGISVQWLGYVPDTDLPALYTGALAVCQPSLYEGFGMPAVEAMACGTPVVAATGSALPEVCGDAALYVDPQDAEAIGSALVALFETADLRRDVIARGLSRAASFSWERCARETLDLLRAAAYG